MFHAQGGKRENSVFVLFGELRQIEKNRVQEEEQPVRSADTRRQVLKMPSAAAAERRSQDPREREPALAIETAREKCGA